MVCKRDRRSGGCVESSSESARSTQLRLKVLLNGLRTRLERRGSSPGSSISCTSGVGEGMVRCAGLAMSCFSLTKLLIFSMMLLEAARFQRTRLYSSESEKMMRKRVRPPLFLGLRILRKTRMR